MLRAPLLVCSLGNPAAYEHTRHSVGHFIVDLVRQRMNLQTFVASPCSTGFVTNASTRALTLFRTNTYMNLSGNAVASAWAYFRKHLDEMAAARSRLVVVYDDLETALGKMKVKTSGKGNGHRGIQSCNTKLGTEDYVRLAIGIGRPASREPSAVSDYVLGQLTPEEIVVLERVVPHVMSTLDSLQAPPLPASKKTSSTTAAATFSASSSPPSPPPSSPPSSSPSSSSPPPPSSSKPPSSSPPSPPSSSPPRSPRPSRPLRSPRPPPAAPPATPPVPPPTLLGPPAPGSPSVSTKANPPSLPSPSAFLPSADGSPKTPPKEGKRKRKFTPW